MTRNDISYQDKLNELRLDIAHPNSAGINFILVEGESDIRLFRKFFNLDKCKVENIPGGNLKLEECVNTLIHNHSLIVGIRDSDFIQLEEIEFNEENILLTDYHDIEMTIISHIPTLNALMFEYTKAPVEQHLEIRDKVMKSIASLSCLKWLNFRENLKFQFRPGFQDLISFTDVDINIQEYISRVLSKSPNAQITDIEVLSKKIESLKALNPDFLQLTNGHDLLKAFAMYFREMEGQRGLKGEQIESSLRMVYDKEAFSQTLLFQSLSEWQEKNEMGIF